MGKVELLMTALEYIEHHLRNDIRTEDLAAACYCSRSTLEKMFRCVFDISVHDYVIRRRMMLAARELTGDSKKSILDIALEYGYSTHESFARAFEQIWNCKPSDFRQRKYTELYPRLQVLAENSEGHGTELKGVDISELYDLFRERRGCYFVCCDVMELMQINQISHRAGDLAILKAMERMVRAAGDRDVVFRIGGDEFCILTDSREQAYAEEIAEEMKAWNGATYAFQGKEITLTLHVAVTNLEEKSIDYENLSRELLKAIQETGCRR